MDDTAIKQIIDAYSKTFLSKLKEFNTQISYFDSWSVHYSDLVGLHPKKHLLSAARFLNPGEGLIFGRLISRLLTLEPAGPIKRLIDLGCGSSLPTLGALLRLRSNNQLEVIGVDIDLDAISTSRKNAELLELGDHYTFHAENLIEFLKNHKFQPGDAIVANPPYVPVPSHADSVFFLPINGGVDGLKFLGPILDYSKSNGVPIAFLASSLTSPSKLLARIRENFRALHCEGVVVPFGKYLKQGVMKNYLEILESKDEVYLARQKDGNSCFMTLGFILDPRHSS